MKTDITAKELMEVIGLVDRAKGGDKINQRIIDTMAKLGYKSQYLHRAKVLTFLGEKLAACDMPQELYHGSEEESCTEKENRVD